MNFFKQTQKAGNVQYIVRGNFHEVPAADVAAICKMYEESLFESYWQLWFSSPFTFAKDIQIMHNDPKQAIRLYAKEIAELTVREWQELNLASVIAVSSTFNGRKIVGFSLFGKDSELKDSRKEANYYLHYIGTMPQHFKTGIGTELMLHTLRFCQKSLPAEAQSFSIKLHTRVFNLPAIHLYDKFGFKVKEKDFSHGHSAKYLCFTNNYKAGLEITKPENKVHFAVPGK